ncbi:MAG: hypothetical protein MI723_08225 [Caulobacterales bacterium]|nr:hypothetical protein [Caulobacterales bacterium]
MRAHTRVRMGATGAFTPAADSAVLGPILRVAPEPKRGAAAARDAAKDRRISEAAEELIETVAPEQAKAEARPRAAETAASKGEPAADEAAGEPRRRGPATGAAKRIQALLEAHSQLESPRVGGGAPDTAARRGGPAGRPKPEPAARAIDPSGEAGPEPVANPRDGARETNAGGVASGDALRETGRADVESAEGEDAKADAAGSDPVVRTRSLGDAEPIAAMTVDEDDPSQPFGAKRAGRRFALGRGGPPSKRFAPLKPRDASQDAPAAMDTPDAEPAARAEPDEPEPRPAHEPAPEPTRPAEPATPEPSAITVAADTPDPVAAAPAAEPEAARPAPLYDGPDDDIAPAPSVVPERAASVDAAGVASFLIVAQLRTTNESAIESVLSEFGTAAPATSGVWFLRAATTCDELRNAVTRKLGGRDSLIIVDASRDEAAWFNIGPDKDSAIRLLRDKTAEAA